MTRLGILIGIALWSVTAVAHHAATGRYDSKNPGEISGQITDIFWRNPHVRILVSRTLDNGQAEEWEVEFGSVNTLDRIGVSRDSLAVGDEVSVYGRMGRNGITAMFADELTLAGGEKVVLQAPERRRYGITEEALRDAREADEALRADIFRVWVPLTRPNTGHNLPDYPLTEAGRAAQASWDPEKDPALQCIPPGLPTVMDNPYPVEFVDQADVIIMRIEEWDGERTIYMDGEGDPVQPRMGRSTGSWDGRTLIVDTRDIDWGYIDDMGTPQSDDVAISERFTLSEDGTSLAWEARITDSANFTEPVVMEGSWTWLPGHEIKPFNCALPDSG